MTPIVRALLFAVGWFSFAGLSVMILVYMERKVAGHFQDRLGPMRTGPHGSLQLLADMIKLITKEDVIPAKADKAAFILAPFMAFVPAFLVYLIIPLGPGWVGRDLNVGILYFLAVPSVSVLGLVMAGWGSHNKFALLGGMRSAAQMISYEIPRALSVLAVVMLAGTLSTVSMVNSQDRLWFIVLQPLAFLIYFIASLAETNRVPFDFPEAESELVAGYGTEYTGIRWGLFFMAEYTAVFAASAIGAVLFLGGWRGPWLPPVIWFLLKTYFLIFVMMWVRWTLPRFRIDQMMDLSWKLLVPLALINLGVTGGLVLLVDKIWG